MGRKKERAGMAKGEAVSAINGLPEAISPYVRLRASRHEERKKKRRSGPERSWMYSRDVAAETKGAIKK